MKKECIDQVVYRQLTKRDLIKMLERFPDDGNIAVMTTIKNRDGDVQSILFNDIFDRW